MLDLAHSEQPRHVRLARSASPARDGWRSVQQRPGERQPVGKLVRGQGSVLPLPIRDAASADVEPEAIGGSVRQPPLTVVPSAAAAWSIASASAAREGDGSPLSLGHVSTVVQPVGQASWSCLGPSVNVD